MSMSARERKVSGRSNLSVRSYADPLKVFHQYNPEVPDKVPAYKLNPPILPKSRFPTVPPIEPLEKARTRPLACPQQFVETVKAPHMFDKASFIRIDDPETKQVLSKEFVERNQDILWQYDTDFLGKTPRTACNMLAGSGKEFLGKMTKYHSREQVLRLSSSSKVSKCLSSKNLDGGFDIEPRDPFGSSLTTSREDRQAKMTKLLAPALSNHDTTHSRGYKHTVGYGNFSNFNSIIKSNKDAMLKR